MGITVHGHDLDWSGSRVGFPVHGPAVTYLWHGDACDCGEEAFGQKCDLSAPIATEDEGVRVSQWQVLVVMTVRQRARDKQSGRPLTAGTSPVYQHCSAC